MAQKKSALFVCLGNICRSPMAEAVFLHLLNQRGVAQSWKVDSAAIGAWHVGKLPDPRTRAVLAKYKIPYDNRARQVKKKDFDEFDYIFGMDDENISDLKGHAPPNSKAKILLLGDFDPQGERIIRDPYYDDDSVGFEKCYEQCLRSCAGFLEQLEKGAV